MTSKTLVMVDADTGKLVEYKVTKPRAKKLDYSIPTFANCIKRIEGVGFIYQVKITTALGVRYYVGKKSFSTSPAWEGYCTTSDEVKDLIRYARANPDRMQIEYSVLEQVKCSDWLLPRENYYILKMFKAVGPDACINIADSFGYSLRTGKKLSK